MYFELSVLDQIQSALGCGFLDAAMPLVTRLGNGGAAWVLLTLLLLLFPKTQRAGAAMAVALGVEMLCCNLLLKPLVARVRPCDVNPAVRLLVPSPRDFSFPSGHTGASFAAASALHFSGSPLRLPALCLAVLIGFSRLYLYVHYPSDVLGGILLGAASGWLGSRIAGLPRRPGENLDRFL